MNKNTVRWYFVFIIPILFIAIMAFTIIRDMQKSDFEVDDSKINFFVNAGFEQYDGVEINDIETIKLIQEKTGVNVNYVPTSQSNEEEFFNAITNNTFDVYYREYKVNELEGYYENGLILNIAPYINYMPNFLELVNENPKIALAYNETNMLYIPIITKNPINTTKLAIRKDWFSTIDQNDITSFNDLKLYLEELESQFEKGSLNNQGKYFVGLSGVNNYIKDFYSSYNTYEGLYIRDDKVFFGANEKEYRNLLIGLNSFVNESLIDTLHFTSDTKSFEKYILTNQTASFFSNTFNINRLREYSYKNGDNIDFTYFDIFPNELGEINNYNYNKSEIQIHNTGYVLSASLSEEEIIDILTYIDFLYSDEGISLLNKNEENFNLLKPEFSVVDGKLQSEKYKIADDLEYHNDFSFMFYNALATKEEKSEYASLKIEIEAFVEEFSQLFIYGKFNPNDEEVWESYLENLEDKGLNRYIELAQENYYKQLERLEGGS